MNATYGVCVLLYVIICKSVTSDGRSSGRDSLSGTDSQVPSGGDNRLLARDSQESSEGSQTSASGSSQQDQTYSQDAPDAHEPVHEGLAQKVQEAPSPFKWRMGIVPFHIDEQSYDYIIARRIRMAMKTIESASCVVFKNVARVPPPASIVSSWLHITNPRNERDCIHELRTGKYGEAVLTLGFECMQKRDIIHALLHILGFNDEVTHPQRDSFVRVLWENIQPKYHSLFSIRNEPPPYQTLVEYDTMSIMHFHDRAYSSNGGATVTPLDRRRQWNEMKNRNRKEPAPLKSVPQVSGLLINPTDGLSQLDKMKLRLAFGHECNKRKVDKLLETCKNTLFNEADKEIDHDRLTMSDSGTSISIGSDTGSDYEVKEEEDNGFNDETRLKEVNNNGKVKVDPDSNSDIGNGDGAAAVRPKYGPNEGKDIDVLLGSKFGDKLGWEKKRG